MSLSVQGTLFKYAGKQGNIAFRSGSHRRHLVLVGGLGDAFLFAPYATVLAKELNTIGWSLVQTMLSSSLIGWGCASLDQDVEELSLLTRHLESAFDSEALILAGHSTGCQDTVRYVNTQGVYQPTAVILQAPLSDQDILATNPETSGRVQLCERMVADGRAEDIAFRDDDGTPVTARRFLAIAKSGGDDDYFSIGFSHEQRQAKIGKVSEVPALALFGGSDEYMPHSEAAEELRGKMAAVLTYPSSQTRVIEGANHALDGHEKEAVAIIIEFVKSVSSQ